MSLPLVSAGNADDLDSFFDDLDSSTQIARELSVEYTAPLPDAVNTSFGSAEFDLTLEEIEELEKPSIKPPPAVDKAQNDRKLMPPPALPTWKPALAKPPTPVAMCSGYTKEELEFFAADDLQLTQVDPG